MASRREMKRIEDVKKAVEADLLSRPGVNGVDIGFKYVNGQKTNQIAIRVLVDEKREVPPEQAIPAEIEGVVTDVIEEKIVLHPVSVPLDELVALVDSTRYEPLRGGISIGPVRPINNSVFVGTAGLVVRDNATNAAMLLSNFHVMAVDNGSNVGDEMVQPGRPDGGRAPADLVGTLQRRFLGGQIDAAVSSIAGRQSVCEIQGIGRVAGTAAAALNAPVRKRGRTTELTHGVVDSINLTVTVDYGPGIGPVTLTNQIGIRVDAAQNPQFGTNGDSGSAVVDANNNVVGLYFAGNTAGTFGVANPIDAVLTALNVSVCTSQPIPPKPRWKEIIDNKGHIKDLKEKRELKEFKEKREMKENLKNELDKSFLEKPIPDKPPKEVFEGKRVPDKSPKENVEGGDPRIPGLPPIEDRLRGLEQTMGQLAHFITSELRPDLNQSALMGEQDLDPSPIPWKSYIKDNLDGEPKQLVKDVVDDPPKGYIKDTVDGGPKQWLKDKVEHKEYLKSEFDKPIPDKPPKEIYEDKNFFEGDPRIPGLPPIEDRLRGLEDALGKLTHFITSELRPDLNQSALMDEDDQQT